MDKQSNFQTKLPVGIRNLIKILNVKHKLVIIGDITFLNQTLSFN